MGNVILYTTNCPMCKGLEFQLDKKNVKYSICEDVEIMRSKGLTNAPALEVDGHVMPTKEAMAFVRGL